MTSTLEELASKVEAAEGPDYTLAWEIHMRNGPENVGMYGKHPDYTASLDAAMSLVPEGWPDRIIGMAGPHTTVTLSRSHPVNRTVHAESSVSPALALTAASLRALAQEQ